MATTAEDLERRWDEFPEEMSIQMSQASFSGSLQGSRPLSQEGEALVVGVAHGSAAEWIEQRMMPGIRGTLERNFPGVTVQVRPLYPNGNGNGPALLPAAETKRPVRDVLDERPAASRAGKRGDAAAAPPRPKDEDDDEAIECDSVTDPALARFDVSTAGWCASTLMLRSKRNNNHKLGRPCGYCGCCATSSCKSCRT